MKRSLSLFGLLFALSACYKAIPPGPPTPRSATSVGASFGKTWEAVIDLIGERNIPIKTVDRSSGLIIAEDVSVGAGHTDLADCGSITKGFPNSPTRAAWNVLVRGDSAQATVKATVRFVHIREGTNLLVASSAAIVECSTKGVWESDLEQQVKQRAEAK